MKKVMLFLCGMALLFFIVPVHAATISNGIYEAHIGDILGVSSIGSWNAVTAAGHPTGANNNLMYDQTIFSTNFSTLRIYNPTAPIDYSYDGNGGGTNLDPLATADGSSALFGAADGWFTTWSIPDTVDIRQDVLIFGSTFSDSAIYHTVEITNTSGDPLSIGWRNLYDWAVNDPGFDDGPNNQVELSDGTVLVPATTYEFSHTPVAGDLARVTVDPGVPTYEPLLGLGFDPLFVPALPTTVPDEYAYVSWPSSFGTAFDYTVNPSWNVTGDSAGLSWFGRDLASSIELQADGSVRLTQTVFGVSPGEPPPGTAVPEPATMLLLGSGLVGLAGLRRRFKKD